MNTPTEALRADLEYVSDALVALHEEIGDNEPTDEQAQRFSSGVEFVETAQATLAARAERAEAVNASRAAVERAAQHPGAIVPSIPESINVNRAADPFDLSDLTPFTPACDLAARALSAVEAVRSDVGDDALEAAAQTLKADNRRGEIAKRYLATGSETYRSAFGKLLAGKNYAITPEEAVAVERAASLVDAQGGFAVPFLLDPSIILTSAGSANPFRQISRVVRGVSDQWNGVSTAGVTASWDLEASEVSDDAPTLAQPSVPAHKAAAFVPFSMEIADDWAGMESDVANLLMVAKDDLEAAAFAVGTGTNQPTGIVTALVAGGAVTATAAADTFAVGDVDALIEAVGPRFRSRGSWVANLAFLNDIRGFGTTDNRYTVDFTAGAIPALHGRPVYEASGMDGVINAGADNYILVFGDFSNYVIFDRVGMSVELIPHLFATQNNRPSGQRGFYARWRVGADSVNDAGFRALNAT
jgi:HK97 family phage major capsid protein